MNGGTYSWLRHMVPIAAEAPVAKTKRVEHRDKDDGYILIWFGVLRWMGDVKDNGGKKKIGFLSPTSTSPYILRQTSHAKHRYLSKQPCFVPSLSKSAWPLGWLRVHGTNPNVNGLGELKL